MVMFHGMTFLFFSIVLRSSIRSLTVSSFGCFFLFISLPLFVKSLCPCFASVTLFLFLPSACALIWLFE